MKETSKDKITQLEDLVVHDPQFRELEREFEYFCPFDAIGMISQEIRHVNFLSYILDPGRPHGFGEKYLNAFLQVAANHSHDHEDSNGPTIEGSSLRPIDVHLLNLDGCRIIREKQDIDLRIELPAAKSEERDGTVLAFEFKVRARESANQLARYRKSLEKIYPNHEVLCFFLTLDGAEASYENKATWVPISFDRVIERFETLSEGAGRTDEASALVRAYTTMMRREHLQDETGKAQKLARSLWHKHGQALDFLVEQKPDEVREYLDFLIMNRVELCKNLSTVPGVTFQADEKRASDGWLFLEVAEWTNAKLVPRAKDEGAIFGISLGREGDTHVHASWTIFEGNTEDRDRIYSALQTRGLVVRTRGRRGVRITSTRKMSFEVDSIPLISGQKITETTGYNAISRFANDKLGDIQDALNAVASNEGR
jgi:hypothetical protein